MADKSKQLEVHKQEANEPEMSERTRDRRVFIPRADIYETEKEIVVLADMSGVSEKDVDINLDKNTLTINGYVDFASYENYCLDSFEYGVGDYQRSFIISDEIDRDKIEATVKNGVLHLHLPKAPAAQARKISVKPG